ncbi:hypothetical protein PANDA_010906, partial [Ailuropoda melanoleuca]
GVSEDCCLDYHPCVGPSFLRNVAGYRRQEVSGSCNLPAVIFGPCSQPNLGTRSPPPQFLFTKDKMLCANPRDSWVQKMMVSLDAGNNTLSKYHRRHLYGALPRCRKSSTGISKLPPPKFRRPPRRNKRKTSLLTKVNPG